MPDKKEFFVETDILVEHLTHKDKGTPSFLEKAMSQGDCFTSVLNASELYFAVSSKEEKEIIDKLLYAVKVLGVSSRYALQTSEFNGKLDTVRDALIASLVKINKLPIVTADKTKYAKTDLNIISPLEL